MSTREEILAALTDHPGGLTYREIAKLCKSCDCDEQIVGRMLTALRSEGVLHADGSRDAMNLYFFGPAAPEPERETPITLNTPPPSHQENPMSKLTVVDRAIEALKQHGPCTMEELAKRVGSTRDSLYTVATQLHALGVDKKRNGRDASVYFLKGQKLNIPVLGEKPDALKAGAELGKVTPPKGHGHRADGTLSGSVSHNGEGNGSRGSSLAGPALFDRALLDLKAKRAEIATRIEKLDRAIEAIEALA